MKTETRTIKISHDNIEDAVAQFLYAIGVIHDNETLHYVDFGLDVDSDNMVTIDLELSIDDRQQKLRLVK